MNQIDTLIAKYGLIAVLIGAGVEGETVVATGGLFAHKGLMPLYGVMAAAAFGSFVADQIFFFLGRYARDTRFIRTITGKKAFAKALRFIERHPVGFIFAFRFMWGFRTVSPIALGTTRVPGRLFVPLNALAAIIWAIVVASVGYVFAGSLSALGVHIRSIEHYALIILAIAIIAGAAAWLVRRYWRGSD